MVVDVLVGDGCSFHVEFRKDFRDETGIDGVSKETIAFDVGKGIWLYVSQELFGYYSREDFPVGFHLLLLVFLEVLDVFELNNKVFTFSC